MLGCMRHSGAYSFLSLREAIPATRIQMTQKARFPKQSLIGRNVMKKTEKPNSRNEARYSDR